MLSSKWICPQQVGNLYTACQDPTNLHVGSIITPGCVAIAMRCLTHCICDSASVAMWCSSEAIEPTIIPESGGMASSRKRLFQELEDDSALNQEVKCAKIYAVVASLSLMKKSTSGFANFLLEEGSSGY